MPLLVPRKTYKPFEYPWAHEAFVSQNQMHWLPEEIPMSDDLNDWEHRLSPEEKTLLTQIFRFFTQADIDVSEGYMTKYMKVFKAPEVRMMLSAFNAMEAIHVHAYSLLIDSLNIKEEGFYAEFLEYTEMAEKHDFLNRFTTDSNKDIAITIAGYSAFTEGLALFASFAILFNFHRSEAGGKMKGMGKIVEWSIRDETLHVESMIKLYHTFTEENPEVMDEDLYKNIMDICHTSVDLEDKFIDLAFDISSTIANLDKDTLKKYIRYVADLRLKQLGLSPFYNIKENPLPWMEELIMPRHTNFFENKVTEYNKGTTQGNWTHSDLHFD